MNHIAGLAAVGIDVTGDPAALARWWQGLVGGEVETDEWGVVTLVAPGLPPLDFVNVPDPKPGKNRVHLDLRAVDFDAAVAAALAHGATTAGDVYDGDEWRVLRDPGGNEFCILRPRAQDERQDSHSSA